MYTFLGIHYKYWLKILFPFYFFMRTRVYPQSSIDQKFSDLEGRSPVYVLPKMSLLDMFVLNKALKTIHQKTIAKDPILRKKRLPFVLALRPRLSLFYPDSTTGFVSDLNTLVVRVREEPTVKIALMPVSIFWSRAAERDEKGFFQGALFPDDGTGNVLQKLFMFLLHRGKVFVFFGKELDLEPPIVTPTIGSMGKKQQEDLDFFYSLKVKRLLHIEFAKERFASFGPTLYEKDKIIQWILTTKPVVTLLEALQNQVKIRKQIIEYVSEIAANYNYITLRAVKRFLDFLWNSVFSGIRVRNFEKIERLARDGQIIWMPSHRSHFDYLLLSYVLFDRGLAAPHVAAGINLDFWPIGSILRHCGAFFIRRSFSGNKVYAAVFSEYVNFLLQNSFPVSFFQEGGRSRTGKLLNPKLGMLSICVQSIISRKAENTYFIPVYFGYDKVMEDNTYAKELRGAKKQKENALQFLNAVRKVWTNYGSVDVSFGEPMRIADVWDSYYQTVLKTTYGSIGLQEVFPAKFSDFVNHFQEYRDPKMSGFVAYLARKVNQKINGAAVASATALLSTALLATTETPVKESTLLYQILLLHWSIETIGKELQWQISTSTSQPYVYEFLQTQQGEPNNGSVEKVQAGPLVEGVPNAVDLSAVVAFARSYVAMGEKWGLLAKEHASSDSHSGATALMYKKTHDKEFNLWWYRGTVFHLSAMFGILGFLLLQSQQTRQPLTVAFLSSQFSLLRLLWQDELFWDQDTPSERIVGACILVFTSLGLVVPQGDVLVAVTNDYAKKTAKFFAQVILPERELYSLQIQTATEMVQQKGTFTKDDLFQKTQVLHGKLYAAGKVLTPPLFSKIFAQRTFDAYYKEKIFVPSEQQNISLDLSLFGVLGDFLTL